MELMASHQFQTALKNYLDIEELGKKLAYRDESLDAYEEIVDLRRAYYQPLLPDVDKAFRVFDSQLRLRLEQRERLDARIKAMLVSPRPDYLATADERIVREKLSEIEKRVKGKKGMEQERIQERIARLKGLLHWQIYTEYDKRLTEAYKHLRELDGAVAEAKMRYGSFVRTRQAATQSYEGYDVMRQFRARVRDAQEQVSALKLRQGRMLELMAINELERRSRRLEEHQVKARFAMADSYDRAVKAQNQSDDN
jgi:hypothetical protein